MLFSILGQRLRDKVAIKKAIELSFNRIFEPKAQCASEANSLIRRALRLFSVMARKTGQLSWNNWQYCRVYSDTYHKLEST